jgi:hypothetical protein
MKYKFEISIMSAAFLVLSLAGVASADSVIKTLYVDGAPVGTSTTTQAISYPYQRLTIGCEGNAWVRYSGLIGQIDEFAVYNRILTADDVNAHATAGAGGYVAAVTASNPVLYLKFTDAGGSGDGSKALNSVNADTNCTYRGAVTLTAAGSGYTGGSDRAAILDGSSCMDVCDWDAKFATTDVSVEFWVKTTQHSSGEYPRFFQHNGGSTEEHSYGAMYTAETNAIGLIGGGSTNYITHPINDGGWHHIVVTFHSIQPGPYATEVMADDPCVYLKFDSQLPLDSSVNGYVAGFGADTSIGTTAGGIGKSLFISRVSQYSFAYVWNNWYDCTGIGPYPCGHRIRQDSPIPPYSRNYSYRFGVDPLTPDVASHITVEMWYKSVGINPDIYSCLFQQVGSYQHEANAPFMMISGSDPNTSTLMLGTGWEKWWTGVRSPIDGQWHQIAVTYDENELVLGHDMTVQLYVDGSLRGTRVAVEDINHPGACRLGSPDAIDDGGGTATTGVKNTFMIGGEGDRWFVCNSLHGWVDEFAIYPSVLSADRIAMHYAAWQPKDCAEVWARGLGMPGDLNHDCVVDFYDYAIFAAEWRMCNTPNGAGCVQPWQ